LPFALFYFQIVSVGGADALRQRKETLLRNRLCCPQSHGYQILIHLLSQLER
jgi:hypothetical protein